MNLNIPEVSLVLLIGPSGAGKSTFGKQHFDEFEVVSSDHCRGIVSNDTNNQAATNDAFDLLHYIIRQRLRNGLLTVIDATNVQRESREKLIRLAREEHALPAAIVLDIPQGICDARNAERPNRSFGKHVVRRQIKQLKRSIRGLKKEGFSRIHVLRSPEEVAAVTGITRDRLYSNKKHISGPFDIIGDIHGCYVETLELLKKLGYLITEVDKTKQNHGFNITHPEDRKVIFLGDLVDRGPNSPAVLKLVMSMVNSGIAYCVAGNHDNKLHRKLKGNNVKTNHGLAETLEQLEGETEVFINELKAFLYSLTSHFVFDDGRLVVAHAGLKENMQGKASGAVRAFCLYGETTGETDEYGFPVRYNWASEYRGKAKVIYGHTAVLEAEWFNNTMDIDTGCVFGGQLTALRYPEEELVAVDAKMTYCESAKPLASSPNNLQQDFDDLLNIDDVIGKRIVQTRLRNNMTIKEENAIAALEVMSRFAINPKWLIYLPPTMSPCETSDLPTFLEHPIQAMEYYKKKGVEKIICEEKHMGSRVVLVICKHTDIVKERFGIGTENIGICYTRTGRNFFTDPVLEKAFLERVGKGLATSNFWEQHQTDWVCLDAELMPWSAKAQALLKDQYAAVGAAASNALPEVEMVLQQALDRGIVDAKDFLDKFVYKKQAISKFKDAYRNYCWDVEGVGDYKLAPFHILATENAVHVDKNHEWHMKNIGLICQADPHFLRQTPYKIVETANKDSMQAATDWWLALTAKGGEGMVVKPYDFITYGKGGLLQPAIKCRGQEYLRIIYGPDYDTPKHLKRLKKRGLSRKRSLAMREFALGIESLERFVKKEPLRRVHESVFGVLALESEEVDPRL